MRQMTRVPSPLVPVILACLLAGCSSPAGPRPGGDPGAGDARPAVEQAYLAWWRARQSAYLALDPAPLSRLASASAIQPDEARMAALRADGHVLRLAADHHLQTVVYPGGTQASVDDVWVDHSVELDPATQAPVQPDPGVAFHESTVLARRDGTWVVDNVWRFGASHPLPGQVVSWAAVAGGQALPAFYARPITDAYLAALAASGAGGPPGGSGESGAGHNLRVAIQQDSVAWVYDTFISGSVTRTSTRLVQDATGWRVQPAP